MIYIDEKYCSNLNTFTRTDIIYVNLFNVFPNHYSVLFGKDRNFVFSPDNIQYVKNIFGTCDIITHIGEDFVFQSNEIKYDVYCNDGEAYYGSNIVIFDIGNKMMFIIYCAGIIALYSSDYRGNIHDILDEMIEKLPVEEKNDLYGRVQLIYQVNGNLDTHYAEINKVNIDLNTHYNDDFIEIDNKIGNFIDDNKKKSGLILLNGEPGTGKSYYIRHLVNKHNRNFIIITPQMASYLSQPMFTDFLVEHQNSIFILEDCEKVLLDREKFGMSDSISSILNMSDGLLSDVYSCKFICTFNSNLESIDQAAMRKGRCVVHYEFKKLSIEKSQNLLNELGYDVKTDKEMSLADIYNYGENNNVKPKTIKKVGF